MPKLPAIAWFDRLYLGSILLYALNPILFWSRMQAAALASPQMQANPALGSMVTGIMAGTLVVTVLVSLLFWWLVSRQRSDVGKWLVVVTEGIGALFAIWSVIALARGIAPYVPSAVLGLVATALAIAAAAMLLRADAQPWFRRDAVPLDREPLA